MKKRLLLVLAVILLSLVLTGCQAMVVGEPVSLEDFLKSLLTSSVIGAALSVILEKVPFVKRYFDKIEDLEWKRLAVLAFCLVLPLAALGAGSWLEYFEITPDTIFGALLVGWQAFSTSTVVHGFIREKPEPEYKAT